MAESAVQREGENESRLHRERLASSRPSDEAAEQNRQRFAGRPSDAAAEQNLQRFAGGTSGAAAQEARPTAQAGDQAIGGMVRQQRLENQLNRSRRQEQKPEKEKEKEGGGAPSLRDAVSLAKANPLAALGMGAAGGGLKTMAGQGLPIADIQRGIGRGCILMLWNALWLSFGHTIYLIGILFFVASTSQYARKYFPEIGEEWFPSQILKKIPKTALIPIKLAEIVGIAFILFWVFLLDMACIGVIALILAVVISAVNLVS